MSEAFQERTAVHPRRAHDPVLMAELEAHMRAGT